MTSAHSWTNQGAFDPRQRSVTLSFRVLLHALIISVAASSLFFLIAYGLYVQEKGTQRELLLKDAQLHANLQFKLVAFELTHAAHDLIFLSNQAGLHHAQGSEDGRNRIIADFSSLVQTSHQTGEISIIDLNGVEKIHLNYSDGKMEVEEDENLHNKNEDAYFADLIDIKKNEIYLSPLELKMKHDTDDTQFLPIIHFGMGIFEADGQRSGYIVMSFLAQGLFDHFRDASLLVRGDVFLSDQDGMVLSAADKSLEWGALRLGNQGFTLAKAISGFWNLISVTDHGVAGDYTFATFQPYKAISISPQFSVHKPDYINTYSWKALTRIDDAMVREEMSSQLDFLRQVYGLAVLLFLLASLPISILLERRRSYTRHVNMLMQTVEYSGESIMVTDPDGVIEYVNPAFTNLTGYSVTDAVDKPVSKLLSSHTQSQSFYEDMWNTITAGQIWTAELIDRKKDGSLFPVAVTISPILDNQGKISRYMALHRDLTERELLHNKAAHESKMKSLSVAIGGIAHEFNNILAGIMGNAFLLKKLENESSGTFSKLNQIETLGNRAAGMIRQMMAYVGYTECVLSEQEVSEFFNGMVVHYKQELGENIKVEYTPIQKPVYINADLAQLQKVFNQLVSNASDALQGIEQPTIKFDFRTNPREKGFICFAVSDNGTGISHDQKDLLFEPFFTTKEIGVGTGLGLSDAYGIIQKHGGHIEVVSSLGKGSTFEVCLPVLK